MGWRSVLRRWNLFLTPLIMKLQMLPNRFTNTGERWNQQ
jgi:hypothetical protein